MMKIAFQLLLIFAGLTGFSAKRNNTPLTSPTAVVLVDLQNDFTQFGKGSLAVAGGNGTKEDYVNKVKSALAYLKNEKKFSIVATQDWHPKGHISFASAHPGKKPFEDIIFLDNNTHQVVDANATDAREQQLWPAHCLQGTFGAKLVEGIAPLVDACVQKGTEKNLESYSGFYKGFFGPDDKRNIKSTLDEILKKKGIKNIIVFGLATDYCVGATAMDGLDFGYQVTFVSDLSEGVTDGTAQGKCEEMKAKGVKIMTFEALKEQMK